MPTPSVYFRADEFARVKARARECGRPHTTFIREATLGAIPRVRPEAAREPLFRELARIGAALDGIARRAAGGADTATPGDLESALRDFRALVHYVVADPTHWAARDL